MNISGTMCINGNVIEQVDSASFVGIVFDNHLLWNMHIDAVNKTIRKKIGIIYKLRDFVPKNILILLYKTFVQPHITHGIEVWGSTFSSYLYFTSSTMDVHAITHSQSMTHSSPLFNTVGILDV